MKLKGCRGGSSGCDLAWKAVSEVLEPAQEAADGLVAVLPIEVSGTEVAVRDALMQDEVSSGEHGGGDGNDGLLAAASGFDALELSA